jgi:hypothetical protein
MKPKNKMEISHTTRVMNVEDEMAVDSAAAHTATAKGAADS